MQRFSPLCWSWCLLLAQATEVQQDRASYIQAAIRRDVGEEVAEARSKVMTRLHDAERVLEAVQNDLLKHLTFNAKVSQQMASAYEDDKKVLCCAYPRKWPTTKEDELGESSIQQLDSCWMWVRVSEEPVTQVRKHCDRFNKQYNDEKRGAGVDKGRWYDSYYQWTLTYGKGYLKNEKTNCDHIDKNTLCKGLPGL